MPTETRELNIHGLLGGETLRGEHAEQWQEALDVQVSALTAAIDPTLKTIRAIDVDRKLTPIGKADRTRLVREAAVKEIQKIAESQREALEQAISEARNAVPLAGPPIPTDSASLMVEAECRAALRAVKDPLVRLAAIDGYARAAHAIIPAVLHDPAYPGDVALLDQEQRQSVLDIWLRAKFPAAFQKLDEIDSTVQLFNGNVQRAIAVVSGPLVPNPEADRLAHDAGAQPV